MAVTGWKTTTSGASWDEQGEGGTIAWSNPGNITTDDTSYATQALSNVAQNKDALRANTFGFSSADFGGSTTPTIVGIEVRLVRKQSASSTLADLTAYLLKAGVSVGTNKADGSTWATGDETITYGNSTEMWGTTWTYTDVTASTFGFALTLPASINIGSTASVDYIEMRIHYNTGIGARAGDQFHGVLF